MCRWTNNDDDDDISIDEIYDFHVVFHHRILLLACCDCSHQTIPSEIFVILGDNWFLYVYIQMEINDFQKHKNFWIQENLKLIINMDQDLWASLSI